MTGAVPAADWRDSAWGPDDEIGAANHITPETVLAASKLIKTGKTYNLGIIVDSDTPAFAPRSLSVSVLQPNQIETDGLGANGMTYNDDIFMGWLGIGSQIDGLGHIGIRHEYYNGHKAADFAKTDGLTRLGIEKIPPLVTRGVLLNMAKFYGQAIVKEGTAYTAKTLSPRPGPKASNSKKATPSCFIPAGWICWMAAPRIASAMSRLNRGLAIPAPNIWPRSASLPWAPTPGGWRPCPLKKAAKASFPCIRS